MTELNKTELYNLHLDLAAKIVPFAGYMMPVQYSSGIIKEHIHCRSKAGFFDISHMGQCFISGDHVAEFLEQLTPANVSSLSINKQLYTVLTNEKGGVIDDIIISRLDSKYLVVVNAACKEKDFSHLRQYLSANCKLQMLSNQALIALQGPAAISVMQELNEKISQLSFMQVIETNINDIPCIVSRSGYTGEDGFEISLANEHVEQLARLILSFEQVQAIGLGARDTLRLEAGLSLYGHELSEENSPIDSGLQWLIQRSEGYLGAEHIKKQLASGAKLQKIGLMVNGKIPVREGSILFDHNDERVGVVTSGSFSPSLGIPVALAQINSLNDNTDFYSQIRNHKVDLTKVDLPFVEHRYRR
jgi:glycine cleavage system T protein (aminomethyltransferase)